MGNKPSTPKDSILQLVLENKLTSESLGTLLAKGCNVNEVDKYHETPLIKAAKKGHIEAVRLLVTQGKADLTIADKTWQRSALSWACAMGHVNVVRYLVEVTSTHLITPNQHFSYTNGLPNTIFSLSSPMIAPIPTSAPLFQIPSVRITSSTSSVSSTSSTSSVSSTSSSTSSVSSSTSTSTPAPLYSAGPFALTVAESSSKDGSSYTLSYGQRSLSVVVGSTSPATPETVRRLSLPVGGGKTAGAPPTPAGKRPTGASFFPVMERLFGTTVTAQQLLAHTDRDGRTPLCIACHQKQLDVLRYLLFETPTLVPEDHLKKALKEGGKKTKELVQLALGTPVTCYYEQEKKKRKLYWNYTGFRVVKEGGFFSARKEETYNWNGGTWFAVDAKNNLVISLDHKTHALLEVEQPERTAFTMQWVTACQFPSFACKMWTEDFAERVRAFFEYAREENKGAADFQRMHEQIAALEAMQRSAAEAGDYSAADKAKTEKDKLMTQLQRLLDGEPGEPLEEKKSGKKSGIATRVPVPIPKDGKEILSRLQAVRVALELATEPLSAQELEAKRTENYKQAMILKESKENFILHMKLIEGYIERVRFLDDQLKPKSPSKEGPKSEEMFSTSGEVEGAPFAYNPELLGLHRTEQQRVVFGPVPMSAPISSSHSEVIPGGVLGIPVTYSTPITASSSPLYSPVYSPPLPMASPEGLPAAHAPAAPLYPQLYPMSYGEPLPLEGHSHQLEGHPHLVSGEVVPEGIESPQIEGVPSTKVVVTPTTTITATTTTTTTPLLPILSTPLGESSSSISSSISSVKSEESQHVQERSQALLAKLQQDLTEKPEGGVVAAGGPPPPSLLAHAAAAAVEARAAAAAAAAASEEKVTVEEPAPASVVISGGGGKQEEEVEEEEVEKEGEKRVEEGRPSGKKVKAKAKVQARAVVVM